MAYEFNDNWHPNQKWGLPPELPSVVLVGVPDKEALEAVIERLNRYNIEHEAYYEPDFDIGLSAVATYPIFDKKQKKAMGTYKLWTPSAEACYV